MAFRPKDFVHIDLHWMHFIFKWQLLHFRPPIVWRKRCGYQILLKIAQTMKTNTFAIHQWAHICSNGYHRMVKQQTFMNHFLRGTVFSTLMHRLHHSRLCVFPYFCLVSINFFILTLHFPSLSVFLFFVFHFGTNTMDYTQHQQNVLSITARNGMKSVNKSRPSFVAMATLNRRQRIHFALTCCSIGIQRTI